MSIHRVESPTMQNLTQEVRDFMRFGDWMYGRYCCCSPYIYTRDHKYAVDLYFHDDNSDRKLVYE